MDIMIVGVGGQGTLLASRVIGKVATDEGFMVKVSEVHGMSQRGGSVVTYVKFGEKVYSPIVEKGRADIILAFEQLEAYRYLDYLKEGGELIVNTQKIDPMPVIIGAADYPEKILEKIRAQKIRMTEYDALSAARAAGNPKTANVALLGVLAAKTAIKKESWAKAIAETVPRKFLDENIAAFDAGYLN